MASAGFAIASLVISAATTAYSIDQSKKSAEAAAETRENLLMRRRTDERNALRENTKRRLDDKKRYLSKLRVAQAASGMSNSGTQLEVFGEIESRLDEQTNEATSQAFSRITNIDSQIANNKFALGQQKAAANMQFVSLAANTFSQGYQMNAAHQDRYGKSMFSIFN